MAGAFTGTRHQSVWKDYPFYPFYPFVEPASRPRTK